MLVFAWILWSFLLLTFVVHGIMFTTGFIAFGNGKEVHFKIGLFTILFNIASFVFLCLYLFG